MLERGQLSGGASLLFEPANSRHAVSGVHRCVRDGRRWFPPQHSTLRLARGVSHGNDLRADAVRREHVQPPMMRIEP